MKKLRSISTQINFTVLPIVIAVFLLVIAVTYSVSKTQLMNSAQKECDYQSKIVTSKIEQHIHLIEQTAKNTVPLLRKIKLNTSNINFLLENIVKNTPHIFGSSLSFGPHKFSKAVKKYAPYIYKKDNKLISLDLATGNYQAENWFSIPWKTKKAYWSNPYFDTIGGKEFMITYSFPVVLTSNKPTAIFTLDTSLNWLSNLANSIKLSKRSVAFIMSNDGTFIAHPNRQFIGKVSLQSLAKKLNQSYLLDIAHDIHQHRSGFKQVHPVSIQEVSRFYYAPIPATNWSIGILFPESDLYQNLNSFTKKITIIVILCIVILFFLLLFISNRITSPLKQLTKKIKSLKDTDWTLLEDSTSNQLEINELYQAFFKMQKELDHHINDIIELNRNKHKLENELKIAQEIQDGILYKIFPPFPNHPQIDLFATIKPAKSVGGDLYDFFEYDNQVYFIVGDVSGKGIPAALYMAITITLLRSHRGKPVNEIMNQVNATLSADNPNMMFTTLFIGALDLQAGILTFCNAGHCFPIIYHEEQVPALLKITHGPALGVTPFKYTSSTICLSPHDKLLLYTDGITEAHNPLDQLYSENNLLECITLHSKLSAKDLCNKVITEVTTFIQDREPFDDLTLLSFNYQEKVDNLKIFRLSITNDAKDLTKINHHITTTLTTIQQEKLQSKLELIAEEVFINIVSYGFPRDTQGEIHFEIRVTSQYLILHFADNGIPFNPLTNQPPKQQGALQERKIGGLGVDLIRQLSHSVTYLYRAQHNTLTIEVEK